MPIQVFLSKPIPVFGAPARTQSDLIHAYMSSSLCAIHSSLSLSLSFFRIKKSHFIHAHIQTYTEMQMPMILSFQTTICECLIFSNWNFQKYALPPAFGQKGVICDLAWFMILPNERKKGTTKQICQRPQIIYWYLPRNICTRYTFSPSLSNSLVLSSFLFLAHFAHVKEIIHCVIVEDFNNSKIPLDLQWS